ncbi:uncharacterized protein SCHCODRAFT_02635677 [Schizophyllum commune H4-8]|uniref:uncharacterized protein n=1 Tax=Schizophyllum commune (strain H4-8 / FGSC 9210) TaxID=578458 RepID=UPI0021607501|nr:uncharacterized protein SCHCODRAFT_02635677 [Schizophyllum commune H4-8]KAI5889806.1 hypothetical protein SCHCODRAFT_02635677 [Schizophyllum commune H4-8]
MSNPGRMQQINLSRASPSRPHRGALSNPTRPLIVRRVGDQRTTSAREVDGTYES